MKTIIQYPNFKKKTLTFGRVNCFSYDQGLMDEINAGLAPEDALFMYRQMLYIRAFETMIVKLRSGEIVPCDGFRFSGATHLSIGQEAVAVGANASLRPDDYITSSHRGHGHGIAKSSYALKAMSPKELQAFIRSVRFQSKQENLLEQALEVHLYRTMAEFLGKKDGYCRGKAMIQPVHDEP